LTKKIEIKSIFELRRWLLWCKISSSTFISLFLFV